VQLGDGDCGETRQYEKQQQICEVSSVFNVEKQMWVYHEEIGRSSTKHDAKEARTDPAD
jgi:hypothetical protein